MHACLFDFSSNIQNSPLRVDVESSICDKRSFGWSDFPAVCGEHNITPELSLYLRCNNIVSDENHDSITRLIAIDGCHGVNWSSEDHADNKSIQRETCLQNNLSDMKRKLCFESRCRFIVPSSQEVDKDRSPTRMRGGFCKDNSIETEKRRRLGRCVNFSTVKVREFCLTLGDHPWVEAYPLSLDWSHSDDVSYDVNEYVMRKKSDERIEDYKSYGRSKIWNCRNTVGHLRRYDLVARRSLLSTVTGQPIELIDALELQRRTKAQDESNTNTNMQLMDVDHK